MCVRVSDVHTSVYYTGLGCIRQPLILTYMYVYVIHNTMIVDRFRFSCFVTKTVKTVQYQFPRQTDTKQLNLCIS